MAMGQRRPRGQKKQWPAGEYTLLTDSQTAEDGVMYSKGDTFVQGEREAMRLVDTGAVVPSGSMHAVRARTESGRGTKRDEYLYEM
jgi:hypothetical protein